MGVSNDNAALCSVYGSVNHRVMNARAGKMPSANRNIRVLSVIGGLTFGGAEARVARFARAVRQYGVDMEICALERVGQNLKPLEDSGITVHGTPYEGRAPDRLDPSSMGRTVNTIRRIVKSGHFDVVHTNLFWADVLGVAGARLAGCRRVIVSRVALHWWSHRQVLRYHALEQFTNLLANEVIADCNASLRDAEEHEPFLPAKRTVIYSGVDVSAYQAAHPSLEGPLRLLHLGVLAPRKGQEYAIEAMALLRQAGVAATLELVGSGPDETMLRRKVSEANLGDLVIFAGDPPDVRPYLSKADIFVFPSRQEGGAIALQEAMASALPVVAADVGGIPELLIDGQGGRIVPPRQPAALAAAVAELAGDRARLAEMGRFNKERIAKLFSLEVSTRKLADWYINGPTSQR